MLPRGHVANRYFFELIGSYRDEATRTTAGWRVTRRACTPARSVEEDLSALVRAHRADDSVGRVVARILRSGLIVIVGGWQAAVFGMSGIAVVLGLLTLAVPESLDKSHRSTGGIGSK